MDNRNIWAPWRFEYLKSLDQTGPCDQAQQCFLCEYRDHPEKDRQNLVLWRTKHCLVLLNRFPYTGGHLLIAPTAHVPALDSLDEQTMLQMMLLARDAQTVLTDSIKPHGFNIGVNIHRCAGAGLPDHVHMHLVPRWDGDTNFMDVTANIRVVSQALSDLHENLTQSASRLNLPSCK